MRGEIAQPHRWKRKWNEAAVLVFREDAVAFARRVGVILLGGRKDSGQFGDRQIQIRTSQIPRQDYESLSTPNVGNRDQIHSRSLPSTAKRARQGIPVTRAGAQ